MPDHPPPKPVADRASPAESSVGPSSVGQSSSVESSSVESLPADGRAADSREPEADGLSLVGEVMDRPPSRNRRRWLVVLLIAALVVPGVVCIGAVASFSTVVHRDPPPDLESPAVIQAQTDAIRRTDAAIAAFAPPGSTPVTTGRSDACVRGSRNIKAWDDFDWVCATRSTAVLTLPATGLRTTLYTERDRLAAAGWTVATDHLDSRIGPTVPGAVPSLAADEFPGESGQNTVELDRDRTRLTLSYGPATAGYLATPLRLQQVEVSSWADSHWEIASPALDREALLAAVRPQAMLVVVTAQHVWFAN